MGTGESQGNTGPVRRKFRIFGLKKKKSRVRPACSTLTTNSLLVLLWKKMKRVIIIMIILIMRFYEMKKVQLSLKTTQTVKTRRIMEIPVLTWVPNMILTVSVTVSVTVTVTVTVSVTVKRKRKRKRNRNRNRKKKNNRK